MIYSPHFRRRTLEWVTSGILFGLGCMMFFVPQTFDNPSIIYFKEVQGLFTYGCLSVGALRILSLFINGKWPDGTPVIRLIGSLAGAGIFGSIIGNLLRAAPEIVSWGIVTYTGLMIAELISSYFSATDAANHAKYRGR